jgi:hypothetical protein
LLKPRLHRLLKKSDRHVLKGRTFRCALLSPFFFAIPRGLLPARNLLSRLFQQPGQPCRSLVKNDLGFSPCETLFLPGLEP